MLKASMLNMVTDLEDPQLRNGRRFFELEDGRKFVLYWTDAEQDFCQITGRFARTLPAYLEIDGERVELNGVELRVYANQALAQPGVVTPQII